jgi:hypothetical protein
VIDEVTAWKARPLEPSYAIVLFDALRVMNDSRAAAQKILIAVVEGLNGFPEANPEGLSRHHSPLHRARDSLLALDCLGE